MKSALDRDMENALAIIGAVAVAFIVIAWCVLSCGGDAFTTSVADGSTSTPVVDEAAADVVVEAATDAHASYVADAPKSVGDGCTPVLYPLAPPNDCDAGPLDAGVWERGSGDVCWGIVAPECTDCVEHLTCGCLLAHDVAGCAALCFDVDGGHDPFVQCPL